MESAAHAVEHRVTLQRTAGRRGLNGPIVPCLVGGASSSVGVLVTVSITTARAPPCRPATATSRSVTNASSKTAAGVIGHPGLPAPSPVAMVSSPGSASATPPPLSLEAKNAWETAGKLKIARNLRVPSMVTGDPGHPGICALSPAGVASRLVSVCVTIHLHSMVVKSVLVMP